jgi:hypothetical protein
MVTGAGRDGRMVVGMMKADRSQARMIANIAAMLMPKTLVTKRMTDVFTIV